MRVNVLRDALTSALERAALTEPPAELLPVPDKDRALGANLIGSLFGGLLQSITFVTGIKLLLLVVAGLYLAAFLTRPRK